MENLWEQAQAQQDGKINYFNRHMLLSDPQPGWLFDIKFLGQHGEDMAPEMQSLIPISIDLPKYETQYVTQMFLGTERSYPINRKYSGESSMEFYIRCDESIYGNLGVYKNIAKIFQTQFGFRHLEKDMTFDKIVLTMHDKTLSETTKYTYINCIITTFELGQVSYEGEEMMKLNLGFHYDFWQKEDKTGTGE